MKESIFLRVTPKSDIVRGFAVDEPDAQKMLRSLWVESNSDPDYFCGIFQAALAMWLADMTVKNESCKIDGMSLNMESWNCAMGILNLMVKCGWYDEAVRLTEIIRCKFVNKTFLDGSSQEDKGDQYAIISLSSDAVLGFCESNLGNPKKALKHYQRATNLMNRHEKMNFNSRLIIKSEIMIGLSNSLIQLGRHDEASNVLRACLFSLSTSIDDLNCRSKLTKNDPSGRYYEGICHQMLGECLRHSGKYDQALFHLHQCLESFEENKEDQFDFGTVHKTNKMRHITNEESGCFDVNGMTLDSSRTRDIIVADIASCYNSLALCYMDAGQLEVGIQHLLHGGTMLVQRFGFDEGKNPCMRVIYGNLASGILSLHLRGGSLKGILPSLPSEWRDLEMASLFINASLEANISEDYKIAAAKNLRLLTKIQMENGNVEEARINQQQSRRFFLTNKETVDRD